MLREKPNSRFHWKNKLDELQNLPGESFNKEMTWNKLHCQLQGKPSNKKFTWYWAAAAVLLFVLMIPFLIHHKKEPVVAKRDVQINQPKKIILTPPFNDKNNIVKSSDDGPIVKDIFFIRRKKSAQKNHIIVNAQMAGQIRLIQYVSYQATTRNLINALQSIDTSANIGLITPPQKKILKVVHINELGDPDEQAPAVTRNSDKHSFQLKFGNQEVFVGPLVTSKATGVTILRTKMSTN
jgi:hypothetical protein